MASNEELLPRDADDEEFFQRDKGMALEPPHIPKHAVVVMLGEFVRIERLLSTP